MAKRLPPEILEYFRRQGAEGGKVGGKRSLETMTPEERRARALKAVAAREAQRAAKAKASTGKPRPTAKQKPRKAKQ
jgi:hypothetical protein